MAKRKRGGFSTSTSAQVTLLASNGTAKTTRATLSTIRNDCLATEKLRAQQVLGELLMHFPGELNTDFREIKAMPSIVLSQKVPCR